MRLGLLEIAVILIVLVAIVVSARMLRANPSSAKQSNNSSVKTRKRLVNGRTRRIWSHLSRAGIVFILIGAIFLFASIGMFKWAFQSYAWSFIILAIGFAMVFLSRKK